MSHFLLVWSVAIISEERGQKCIYILHCWTITNNNDLFIYFVYILVYILICSNTFFNHIRQNSFYTVINAVN